MGESLYRGGDTVWRVFNVVLTLCEGVVNVVVLLCVGVFNVVISLCRVVFNVVLTLCWESLASWFTVERGGGSLT